MAAVDPRRWFTDPRFAAWLYGFRAPEHGRIVLGLRRVYILPARLGLVYGAVCAVLLVGSVNYALSLGYLLAFALGGLGLVGLVHTVRNLARLQVSAGRVEPAFAGEAAQFRLLLENLTGADRPSILVRQLASGAQVVIDLPARGAAEAVLAVPAPQRGWLALGRVMLETRFPLGLFRAWSYVEPGTRALVWPKPEHTPLPAQASDASQGTERRIAAGNDDFAGLRPAQRADPPRQIAWKAVARTGDLLAKQFSGEAGARLWLDWSLLPAHLDAEARLSWLTGWVLDADRAGLRYGLRLPGVELEPAQGEAHRAECLARLALWGMDGEAAVTDRR